MSKTTKLQIASEFEEGKIYLFGTDRYMCVRATLGMGTLCSIPPADYDIMKGWNHAVYEVPQDQAHEWFAEDGEQ